VFSVILVKPEYDNLVVIISNSRPFVVFCEHVRGPSLTRSDMYIPGGKIELPIFQDSLSFLGLAATAMLN